LEVLECYQNKLISLDLSSYPKLRILSCYQNQLKYLILPNFNQITIIKASNNYLINFNYSCLNHDFLRELHIENNNLEPTDLLIFLLFLT